MVVWASQSKNSLWEGVKGKKKLKKSGGQKFQRRRTFGKILRVGKLNKELEGHFLFSLGKGNLFCGNKLLLNTQQEAGQGTVNNALIMWFFYLSLTA